MHSIFVTNFNNNSGLVKLGAHFVNESIKVADSVVDKIKNGFLSLLKSISNSFKCLVKLFSVYKGTHHINTDKKSNIHFETVPSVAIEAKDRTIHEDNSSRSAQQAEFYKLKTEMHAKLGAIFKHQKDN